MPVNSELNNIREAANNLRLIKKYMKILESNYSRKKEETIQAIQEAGYTLEDIRTIKGIYCGRTGVTLDFGYRHLDEMKEISEKLKSINEKVIYDGERSGQATQKTHEKSADAQTIEHVNAEIVPESELAEMRRRQEEKEAQKDIDSMIRMVNDHSDKVKFEQAASVITGRRQDGHTSSRTKSQKFRDQMAEMARQTSSSTAYRDHGDDYSQSFGGRRQATNYRSESRRKETRPGAHLPKRNLKNKPKGLKTKDFVRRLAAGALAISFIAGAYAFHRNNQYEADVESRIEYVDDIIDRNGTIQDYSTYCGIDFTEEELNKFLEVESKIDSFEGKESTELNVVDIITTTEQFGEIYKDIVKERLEEGFGYSIDDNEIKVVRERDDLDGRPGDYNENGDISQIGHMELIKDKNIPKELRNSVIAAFGGQGIEAPAMSVEELIYKLDNQEITKAEASEYLSAMLDDAKELMTRQYEEKSYGKLQEKETTYDKVKEKEDEQAKLEGNSQENTAQVVEDDELDR